VQEEEREHVDFAERLSRVNLTTDKGPMSPHHLSTTPRGPLLRHSRISDGNDIPFFGIQNAPPPRRVEYRNQKSLRKQNHDISLSLTTLGPSAEGSINFLDTLGRCHIDEDSDDCGFRWFPEGSTMEGFAASEFVGYNQGLGRVYFKSFFHRGRKIEVGNFVKKRFGNTIEYYRIAAAFQATASFLGDWEDGTFPPPGKRNPHKGEIQKRGHPYLIAVPLKLKTDIVSGKARKKLKKVRRIPSSVASDSESDAGFTSCDSDDGGGGRLGITNKKRRLPGGGAKSPFQGEQVEQELVLTREELEEPNNIFVLPMWLGEASVTFETISVRCRSEQGEDWIIKATENGGSGSARKRHRALNGETFVCRQSMAHTQWNKAALHKKSRKKRRRRDLKEPKVTPNIETEDDGLLTKYLADEQFQLLTAKPKELLEDFIPPQWAFSFNACRTHFISSWEERPWYDDAAPELDYFPNPYGSSDDSDGFDEESNAVLRGDVELAARSETVKVLDLGATANSSKAQSRQLDAQDIESADESVDAELRVPAPGIGKGWTMTEIQRKSGLANAKKDRIWHSPCGQEFHSIVQVKRFKAEKARQLRKSAPRTRSKKSLEAQTEPRNDPMEVEPKGSDPGIEPMDAQPESIATDLVETIATIAVEQVELEESGVEDAAGDAYAVRPVGCITVGDLKNNTEALYAAAASHHGGLLSKSTMIKQAAHLRKVSHKPSLEESLPLLFLHNTDVTAQHNPSRSEPPSPSSRAVPRYVVERKDSTQQIASRVAYLMHHHKLSNASSRPKALCYCLKASYAKTMAAKLRKAGVNAQPHIPTTASNRIAEFASGTSIDVLCLESEVMTPAGSLPHVDFIFHVYVPPSLAFYAQETMGSIPHRPPSLCILFHRHTDVVETRKSLGLPKHKEEEIESMEENALDDVLAFASDGTVCRGSTLLGTLGDRAPKLRCGGAECCDNCRFRLGLEGSPLALKNSSRTISMGRGSRDNQDMINCTLDITQYVLEAFREANITGTKSSVGKRVLAASFEDIWDSRDCPSSAGSISAREWDRISPIRGISIKLFLRRQLLHFFQEQRIVTPPTKNKPTLYGIDKARLTRFVADAEDGKMKITVRNVRLFQSYLNALPSTVRDNVHNDTAIASVNTYKSAPISARASTATVSQKVNRIEAEAVAPTENAVEEALVTAALKTSTLISEETDELTKELLANEELMDHYLDQDESDLPVKMEELKAIDNGATFFPRLTIPLGSLLWITNLPHLIQYEIWRLWNAKPRKLTMDQLNRSIRTHLQQHPTITLHDACVYIHSVARGSSAQAYMDALKNNESKCIECIESKVPIIFPAALESTGDRLSLQSPELAADCRVYRKFDSSRFLRLLIPTELLGAGSQPFHTSPHGFDESGAMLNSPLYVVGRYYRYIFPDLDADPKSLLYFAERGAGIAKEEEMSVDDIRDWCLPRNLNNHLTVTEEQISTSLCFAPSIACCLLPSGSLCVEEGPSHDLHGMKFNGGCGRISRAALDLVWASDKEGTESCPWSSFEGAIGCMRGVWVLDPTLGDGIKVICRPSQQIFNLPMRCLASLPSSSTSSPEKYQTSSRNASDDAYDTVEVHRWDCFKLHNTDAFLNFRLIQALEYRGVSAATLSRCADMACISGSVSSLQEIRAQVAYPLEKCRLLRIVPDHTGLLKPGEAFLATCQLPLAENAGQVIVSPRDPLHGDDILKLNLVAQDVLRKRDRESSSKFCSFFDGLQTGIVIGKGCRDTSDRSGGEFFGKVLVCWLEQVVSKIGEASSAKDRLTRQSHRPQIDELCLRQLREDEDEEIENAKMNGGNDANVTMAGTMTTGENCTSVPGQYLFRKLKQEWFLAQMDDLLTILNDLKGPNSVETLRIAATVDEMTKHPYHIYDMESLKHDVTPSHVHCPDWFCEALAKPNHSGMCMSSKALKVTRYKSTRANGTLWQYVGTRIKDAGARAEQDDASNLDEMI